jgi:hypothetical protein
MDLRPHSPPDPPSRDSPPIEPMPVDAPASPQDDECYCCAEKRRRVEIDCMLLTHETELNAKGRVQELEDIAKQNKRESEVLLAETKELLAQAAAELERARAENEWPVNFVSDSRIRRGVKQYRVHWVPTWEDEADMENAQGKIDEYECARSESDSDVSVA